MNRYKYRFLQSMITSGLAAILTERLLDGKLSFFINMRYAPLTITGIAILLVISGIGAFDIEKKLESFSGNDSNSSQKIRQFLFLPFLPFFASLMGMSTPVYTSVWGLVFLTGIIRLAHIDTISTASLNKSTGTWRNLVFVAIPLIILAFVPTKPLSVDALSTRGINLSSSSSLAKKSPVTLKADPTDRTVLDWVTLFDSESDTSKHIGSTASVIGFVYHDDRLTGNKIMVGRFTITCCVADAFAVGMVIDSHDASTFENDTWVKVDGTLDEITIDGVKIPMIHASSITEIEPPAQPYLYP